MVMLCNGQRIKGKKSICYAMGKEKRKEKISRDRCTDDAKRAVFARGCQFYESMRIIIVRTDSRNFDNKIQARLQWNPPACEVRTSFHFWNIASYSHPFVWFCQRGGSMEGRGWEEEDAVLYSAAPPARAIRPYGAGPSSLLIIDWGKEAGTSLPSGLLFCNLGGLAWQHHLPIPSHSQVIRQNLNHQKFWTNNF